MKEQKVLVDALEPLPTPESLIHDKWKGKVAVAEATDLESAVKDRRLIVAGRGLSPEAVLELATQEGISNIVQESPNFARGLNTAALMKEEPSRFLSSPISAIFDPENSGASREKELSGLSIEFRAASERNSIRLQISSYLKRISSPDGVRENVYMISDELISNVIFNAPYQVHSGDSDSDPGTAFVTPKDTLPEGMTARLFLAAHGDTLLIGCEDSFGSMNVQKVLSRLDRCHFQGVDRNIRWNGRGAGIGLLLVYERSVSLYLAVDPKVKTLVCAQISILKSERSRSAVPKCMHYLVVES